MNSNQRKLTARIISMLLFVSLLAGFAPGFVRQADAAPGDKSILSFSFASPPASGVISGNNITVMVPYGTDVTALVPTITHNGASISPNSGVAQNFTNPVTYTVTAADATTQNYLVSVVIPITVTANAGQSKVFGSADPVFAYTPSNPVTFTGALSRVAGESVGSYAIQQGTLAAVGSNYSIIFVLNSFSITPKPVTVTPAVGQNKVFGSADPAFTYTSSDPAATFTGALSRAAGENVGAYAFALGTLSAGSNYTLSLAPENFSITPKPVTVTPSAGQSKVFGSADPAFTYTSSDPAATFTGALSRVAGENVGTYAFNLGTLSAGGNYTLSLAAANFSVTPKPVIVTPTVGQNKVFGSADPAFTYTSSDPAATFTGALSRVSGENAGTYGFTLGTLSAGSNYSLGIAAENFTITPKPVTITPTSGQSKVFGSPDPVYTYTSSDPAATFTGSLSHVVGENVGTYAFTLGTLSAGGNYSLSIAADYFSITPKPITVTPTVGQSKVFGSADPAFTYTSSDPAATFTGALSRAAGENVGTYAFALGTLSAGGNYTVSLAAGNFSITPKPLIVTPTAGQSKVSGLPDPVFTYASSDPAATFTGALSRVAGEAVGTYAYTLGTLSAGTNYSLGIAAETFAILPGPSKDITAFSFTTPAAVGIISGTNISVTVPYGTDVTALVATFTTTGSSVKVGATTQVSGTTPNNFTSPVVYTVTALDASTKDYTVTVTAAPNPAKDITAFSFTTPAAVGTISGTNISVTVPYGTNVTALVATFTTTGASVKVGATTQVSGTTPNNFTSPVVYTVTALDASTKDYTVTVTAAPNPAKDITAFSFTTPAAVGTISGTNILVTVPYGTNVTALVATFTTTGASVKVGSTTQVSGTTPNNFTSPVVYTVTAADSSTKDYTITVTFSSNPAKDITDFRFVAQTAVGVIEGSNISVTVPGGTDVSALAATFTTTGTSVKIGSATQVSGVTFNDFTNPLTYTVTAVDGSTKDYTVRVAVAPGSEKDITDFHFVTPDAVGSISGTNIAVTVPYGTDVRALKAFFTTNGASVKVGFTSQVSGSTLNDFTNPVFYTVVAADNSTKTYTVTVSVAPDSQSKDITSFGFADLAVRGSISGTNISVTVPYGTNTSALVAEFVTTGVSVKVGDVEQVSGITANNFSNTSRRLVTYTVTAADGSKKDYSVKVNQAAKPSKEITSFGFVNPAVTGTIKGTDIEVKVPYGTDLSTLVATFTTTGVSVKVGNVEQESGVTLNGFTKPLTYVVVAGDKSKKSYKVTVLIVSKDITSFVFKDPSVTGVIDGNNISVTVPHGTDVRKLVATFKTTGTSVLVNSKKQDSGKTPNDFSKPVTYIVTASDKSTRPYTVTVTIARKIVTEKFRSTGRRDGWVLESGEYSNVGGSSETNTVIRLGDDSADRQYRALLHFPTYYLPDNAVVTKALLMIQRKGAVGTDPFTTHGPVSVDISKGSFVNINLNNYEPLPFELFETSADMYSAGTIQNNPDAGWYWTLLDEDALAYVNLIGVTQVRLSFQLDDNDDLEHDYLEFYSGDQVPLNNRPYLLVDYYVP